MRYIISVIKSKILLLLLKENKPLCANCITKMIGEGESYFQRQKVSVNLTQLKDKGLVRKTGFLWKVKIVIQEQRRGL